MFRWASVQLLPPALIDQLGRAGGLRSPWWEREAGAVLVYVAPHQLLGEGRLPLEAIRISYQLTLTAVQAAQGLAIHGERLLHCSPASLAQWVPGQPLPSCDPLALAPALEAALTAAILRSAPELAADYIQLEQLCERGDSPADLDYLRRLETPQAEALTLAWNQQQALLAGQDLQHEQLHQLRQMNQQAEALMRRSIRLVSRLLYGR